MKEPVALPIPIYRWVVGPIVNELELVDLVPPFALSGGLWACERFQELAATGVITRGAASIKRWIADPRESEVTHNRRQTMFDQATALLAGRKLEEAGEAFRAAYRDHLQRDAGVAATKLVVHGLYADAKNGRVMRLPAQLAPDILATLEWEEEDGGLALD
jgi:hypothetical protein